MKKQMSVLIVLTVLLMSVTAFARESTLTDWTVNKSGASYYEVVCDRTETSDGGSNSLRMYVEKESDSGYAEIRSVGILPEKSAEYVLEFDYKTDSTAETIASTVYAGSATRNLIASADRTLSGGKDWKRYSVEFKTTQNQGVITVRIKLSEGNTKLWIDNMSLRRKGAEDNLLHNANMDADLNTAPGPVTELTHSSVYADDITVSWKNPEDSDIDFISVKNLLTNEETKLEKGTVSFTVKNAPRGTKYSYEITSVDVDGNVSSAVSVDFIADVVEYAVNAPVISEAEGKARISVTCVNNKIESGKKLTLAAFIYDNDILTDAKAVINVIPANGEDTETMLELEIPEGKSFGECTVKAYVFEDFESMRGV